MHRRTLDIHQAEANIVACSFTPLMIPDLPTYLKMRLASGDVLDKSTLYIAPTLRVRPDEK